MILLKEKLQFTSTYFFLFNIWLWHTAATVYRVYCTVYSVQFEDLLGAHLPRFLV